MSENITSAVKRICPHCGREQEPEWLRCPFCGASHESWPSGFQKTLLRFFVAITFIFMGVLGSCIAGLFFRDFPLETNLAILCTGAGIFALIFDHLVFRAPKSSRRSKRKRRFENQSKDFK